MIRVVITGVGAVTPLGNSFQDSWNAVKSGTSGIHEVTKVDGSEIKWSSAGELKHFRADAYLGQKELRRLDPFVHYAVSAAAMSAEDAGLIQANSLPCRNEYLTLGGVIIGSSRG
jgi:3-oxoacyl-[acyl-carrier-protein] synthase II